MPAIPLRLHRAVISVFPAALLGLGLSACSKDSAEDDLDMPVAFNVVGQADYASNQSNAGSSVNALGLAQPLGGIATDGNKFYAADYGNHRVLGWNSIPATTSVTPDFVIGQSSFTEHGSGIGADRLALPTSVAVADGHLVVADSGNNRVLIWNTLPSANTPADVVVGQSDFTQGDSGASASQLNSPVSASIAGNRLFVVDQYNNRVLIWNTVPSTSGAAADVVLGQAAFGTTASGDEEDGLSNPSGLWTDGLRLLVADSGNNRVLFWSSVPRSSGADATYVIGQTDFSRTSAGVGQAALRTPYGVTSDGTRIYIADVGNNRVLKFDSFPIANGPSAVDIYGQSTFTLSIANDDDQDGDSDDEPSDRTLSSPTGVSYFNNVLYVTDRSNHRLLFFPD